MNIENRLLTPNTFSRPGKRLPFVKGIVIHYTAAPGQRAVNTRGYFESLKNQNPEADHLVFASAHFIVDLDGHIIQDLPLDEMAYHCGAQSYKEEAMMRLSTYPNNCTLGIELCHKNSSGAFSDDTLTAAAELAAHLCRQFSLNPETSLWRHFDITGKDCPKYFVAHEDKWNQFVALVNEYYKEENDGTER